ncbi:MAG: lytic transglycosylase domain-containing protein [Pseudomonadota bacterium]
MRRTALLVITLSAIGAKAQERPDPPPFQDFTFRRVAPPASDGEPRIRVQIGPETDVVAIPDAAPEESLGAAALPFDWFWATVSRDLDVDPAERFRRAMQALTDGAAAGQGAAPSLDDMRRITETYRADLLGLTVGTAVSPALAAAVIHAESSGKPEAESSAGAVGLMQLMPETASRFEVQDRTDPTQNIRGGVAFLDELMGVFDRDPILVLAAYNAGETAVRENAGVPPYPETLGYVPRVLAAWNVARALCVTPPDLVTDGCVFIGG